MTINTTAPQVGMKSSFAMLVDDYFRNDPVNGRMYIPEMNHFEQYIRRLQDEEDKVLITADTENVASWKTIERCHGVLESELISKHYGKLIRRYWIAL